MTTPRRPPGHIEGTPLNAMDPGQTFVRRFARRSAFGSTLERLLSGCEMTAAPTLAATRLSPACELTEPETTSLVQHVSAQALADFSGDPNGSEKDEFGAPPSGAPFLSSDEVLLFQSRRRRRLANRIARRHDTAKRLQCLARDSRALERLSDHQRQQLREAEREWPGDLEAVDGEGREVLLAFLRAVWGRVKLAVGDVTSVHSRVMQSRIQDRVYAARVTQSAVVRRVDGSCLRSLAGSDSSARRARAIIALGYVLAEANRLQVRGISHCVLARLVSDPHGQSYQRCRVCEHAHVNLRTLSHQDADGNDSIETGDVGYLQALSLTGAVSWHQYRHSIGVAANHENWERGSSGYPCCVYTVHGRVARERLSVEGIIDQALLAEFAELLLDSALEARRNHRCDYDADYAPYDSPS
jgi:hypothetical protein